MSSLGPSPQLSMRLRDVELCEDVCALFCRGTQKENHMYWTKDEWLAGFGIWEIFLKLCVVLLVENAGVVRYLPGIPWPFRNPCCQLSSAPTVSQGCVLAFPGEISCKNQVYSFKKKFFQRSTTNPITVVILSRNPRNRKPCECFSVNSFLLSKSSFLPESEKLCPL